MAGAVAKIPGLVNLAIAEAKPRLRVFMKYAKVELAPPKLTEIGEIKSGIGKLVRGAKNSEWKKLTVKEAWLNTLVGMEVIFWFYIGECIGKRHLVGYKV